jgi:hypothetical protein
MPVNIIQVFAFVLILPPDSNVESSNMASLDSIVWFLLSKTPRKPYLFPGANPVYESELTLSELTRLVQSIVQGGDTKLVQNWCKIPFIFFGGGCYQS